jgi:glycosyltransferase involved in cell wall biosynthesis
MIHIVGIVGVPGSYGGFETLTEYLLDSAKIQSVGVTVYCEKEVFLAQGGHYKGAKLVSIAWRANGWQSVFYDLSALLIASRKGGKVLILGTSATFILPILRLFFRKTSYIVNMAGLEWSRSKWGPFARWFLKFNEMIAARYAHSFITDNQGLKDYIDLTYRRDSILIPYGGDQFLTAESSKCVFEEFSLPDKFDFAMARAQPDNNIEIILRAYAESGFNLVFVSNWRSSKFGQEILEKYGNVSNIKLIGPIYDIAKVKALYLKTRFYVHGHSAGGTNPVLVESMWARLPILAFDVNFNRHTTENKAFYFTTPEDLAGISKALTEVQRSECADMLFSVASSKYKWKDVLTAYEAVIFNEDFR